MAQGYHALVTGGAGFIGTNLVRALAVAGWHVRVLDNFSTGKREHLIEARQRFPDIAVIEGDIRSFDDCTVACAGVTHVFHEAALRSVPRSVDDPSASHDVNVTGTLNMLRAAHDANVRRFVYASSSSVYGDSEQMPQREDQAPRPISPYAVSKLAGGHYGISFWKTFGLETIALRYFNVFGPYQNPESKYSALIPAFASQIAHGDPLEIHSDGLQARDFTYIDDVVRANLLAALAPSECAGGVFNVARGETRTVLDIANALVEICGVDPGRRHTSPRAGDVRLTYANINRARVLLGYEPTIAFDEALRRTIEHLRRHTDLFAQSSDGVTQEGRSEQVA